MATPDAYSLPLTRQADTRFQKDIPITIEPKADATIAVFRATGQTGRYVLNHALEQGHGVQAFERDPEKLRIEEDRLTVITGDFDNVEVLWETVRGATHVICCAGSTYDKNYDKGMMARFIAQRWPILDAEISIRTFLFQSAFFAPEPDGSNPVILKLLAPVAA